MVLLDDVRWDSFPCASCDLCTSVCPVEKVNKSGEDSPRNRVLLAQGLWSGETVPEESVFNVMFRCSLCGRCDDVCPSDLPVTDVIIAAREMLHDHVPDRARGMIDRLLRDGTPFQPEPAAEIEGNGTLYFADPVSRSTGVASSVVRKLASAGTGIGAIGGNSGLYDRVLGDAEGFAEKRSNFVSSLEDRDVTKLVLSNPEEMEHISYHLDIGVEVLTLDEIGPIGPTDREYILTPFEARGRVPTPQIRSATPIEVECEVGGGLMPLFPRTAKDIASSVGDHLVTGDPLTMQFLRERRRDIVHAADLLQ